MLACTALLALFLGFGKRRHELALENAGKQRAALEAYTAAVAHGRPRDHRARRRLVTYVAYTLDPATRAAFNSNYLWLTAPFTAFGILRFLLLVSGRAGRGLRAESPTQEMLRDVPFVLNLVIWAIVVMAIVYQLRPSPSHDSQPVAAEYWTVARALAHRGWDDERPADPATLAAKPGGWTELALTLPVFLVYQLGVVFLNVRNATDLVTVALARARQRRPDDVPRADVGGGARAHVRLRFPRARRQSFRAEQDRPDRGRGRGVRHRDGHGDVVGRGQDVRRRPGADWSTAPSPGS